jgi:hypothetical protein
VKYEFTPAFIADLRRLKPEHLRQFRETVASKFAPACDAYVADPSYVWPASLRVSQLRGTQNIMELTWSFASPDGRATFEFVTIDGEVYCRWRRVGDHGVYRNP